MLELAELNAVAKLLENSPSTQVLKLSTFLEEFNIYLNEEHAQLFAAASNTRSKARRSSAPQPDGRVNASGRRGGRRTSAPTPRPNPSEDTRRVWYRAASAHVSANGMRMMTPLKCVYLNCGQGLQHDEMENKLFCENSRRACTRADEGFNPHQVTPAGAKKGEYTEKKVYRTWVPSFNTLEAHY